MPFDDLDEFFDPTLRLPIGGKTYVVPPPDALTGIWVARLLTVAVRARATSGPKLENDDVAALKLEDDDERSMYERTLGTAYGEMVADGIDWERLRHAGITAMLWIGHDRAKAEEYWRTGGDPKEPPSTSSQSPNP